MFFKGRLPMETRTPVKSFMGGAGGVRTIQPTPVGAGLRMKEGGSVMEKRHAAWMKSHGAPASMVKEEESEKMKCGGKVNKKPKKFAAGGKVSDSAKNDRLAPDFLNQGKKVMGTAGGGPRRGGVSKKYASGGTVRGAGAALRGKKFTCCG